MVSHGIRSTLSVCYIMVYVFIGLWQRVSAYDPQFSITEINIPGATDVQPSDINDRGQVVGIALKDGIWRGFVWETSAGEPEITDLGSFQPRRMNVHGVAVGTLGIHPNAKAAVMRHGAVELVMQEPCSSFGYDVNDSGDILAGRYNNESCPSPFQSFHFFSSFVANTDGSIRWLPPLKVGDGTTCKLEYYVGSVASGLSNTGMAIGASANVDCESMRPAVWHETIPANLLNRNFGIYVPYSPQHPEDLILRDINNHGVVVGSYCPEPGNPHRCESPFIWSESIGMQMLPLPELCRFHYLRLNDRGQVVGYAECPNSLKPLIYGLNDAEPDFVDIHSHLPLDSQWVLQSVAAINNCGQIVGSGKLEGQPRGFLLNPTLDAVDLNDPMFRDPSIPLTTRLSHGGSDVEGLAADGVTRILIRLGGLGDGSFQIKVTDENGSTDPAHVGELSNAFESEQFGNPLVLGSVYVPSEHTWMILVRLTAPLDFDRDSSDNDLGERELTIEFGVPNIGPCITKKIKLVRPPVVLMHGLWGDADTWRWGLAGGPAGLPPTVAGFEVCAYQYKEDNAKSFSHNMRHVRNAVDGARRRLINQKIATTQVDYVGHSMGGTLGRVFAGTQDYLRPDNFLSGDFHKLITVNAPLFGSKLAPRLTRLDNTRTVCGWIWETLFGYPVAEGGVRDLRPDSPPLCSLPALDLPVHALYSEEPSSTTITFVNLFALLFCLGTNSTLDAIFDEPHDGIVESSSQRGGLASPHITRFTGEDHSAATDRGDYNDRVVPLLFDRVGHAPFAVGLSGRSCARNGVSDEFLLTGSMVEQDPVQSISITSPVGGASYAPGEQVAVVVEPLGNFVPTHILVAGRNTANFLGTTPFEGFLTIPLISIGNFEIRAFATDESGLFAASAPVNLSITTDAKLIEFSIQPKPLTMFSYLPNARLRTLGLFDDGITRDLTSNTVGTTFSTLNPQIATVESSGQVRAVGLGRTTIRAENSGLSASVEVEVVSIPNDRNQDGHIDLLDHGGFVACMEGPESVASDVSCRDFFDVDNDKDIDLGDFAALANAFAPF